jgi:hypothetical protein
MVILRLFYLGPGLGLRMGPLLRRTLIRHSLERRRTCTFSYYDNFLNNLHSGINRGTGS